MSFRIKIEDTIYDLDLRFCDQSPLFSELYDEKSQEIIELSQVNKTIWNIIQIYYITNNFNPQQIIVNCDDENKVFNEQDLQIIKMIKQSNVSIHQFLFAATYLNLPKFYDLLISKLAVDFYVDPTKPKESIENLIKKYPNVPVVTKEEIQQYNQILQHLL